MKIYVGNLDRNIDGDEVRKSFAAFGAVSNAFVVFDRETGQSRGFAFVEMDDRENGTSAITALNDTLIGQNKVIVNEARQQTDRSGGRKGSNRN